MYLRQWKLITQVFLITQKVLSVGVLLEKLRIIPFLDHQNSSEDHSWETQLIFGAVKKLIYGA